MASVARIDMRRYQFLFLARCRWVQLLVLIACLFNLFGNGSGAQMQSSAARIPAAQQQPANPGQAAPVMRMTVQEAVRYALDHYPAVRASLEAYNTARSRVGLAATAYVPRLDALWQGDRGTRNSVLGVLLPQFPTVLPSTQGSVLPPSDRAYWASGMGVLFTWEPFEFGYRRSQLRSARSTMQRTSAQVSLTQLGVATAVADAALAVLADEQRVKASQADVDRRTVFARSVHALVDAHLRPGADASRADAELATARTLLFQAQEEQETASAYFAEALGLAGTRVEIEPGPFLTSPPAKIWSAGPLTAHPAAVVEQRRVAEADARINVLNHSYFPHFTLEALGSARGSGENLNGSSSGGLSGLGMNVHNWEAGLTVWFPLLDYPSIRERKKIELANRRREVALYELTMQQLTGQLKAEYAILSGARRVAQNTPVELKASRDSEIQALARFQAGVGTIVDVAEAQRLLIQAEIDDSLARLSIWRALADLASAEGDIRPFLDLANSLATGAP